MYACLVGGGGAIYGGQKKVSDPLELELQVSLSHPQWVVGTELWSSEKAAHVLNH